jgi:5-methyltetrahydrofolate--homocysteine methyltransferase
LPRHDARDIQELFADRILVFDGAMGTQIQALGLSADDFGGPELDGCNEHLVLSRPDVIERIHREYLDAGADIIETDSFGGTRIVLEEYGLADKVVPLNRAAAALARRAADEYSTPARPRLVAGSMGPGTKNLSLTGGVTWEEIEEAYYEQALGLLDGGADLLLLETAQDTRNVKAAALGILRAMDETALHVPLCVSGTIELMGAMLAGQGVEAFAVALEHLPLFAIGINCATGPTFMTDHVRALSHIARTRVTCIPNAGLPNESGAYLETPAMMASVLARFADEGWLNALGGCCGTTPQHICAFAEVAAAHRPRTIPGYRRTQVSGVDCLAVEEDGRPYLVGERANVLGSRQFKALIAEGRYDDAAEVGRRQVRGGAHVLDVCLQDPDRDELDDMRAFLGRLVRMVRVPLMLDSTDARVLEEGLKFSQGKAIINSINLEDGEERFRRVVPLARRYGAALVVGAIDEDPQQGMAVTTERKLEVADRAYHLLTETYGVPPEDILWDALVFPVGTGDATYMHAARHTMDALPLLKDRFAGTKTILGVSNVSFGLPAAGREVLNSVFLYHCTKAGLDLAIVNTERLVRYASIPLEERRLAEALLFDNNDEAIQRFSEAFRARKQQPAAAAFASLNLDERLARYIVEGARDGLIADLDNALRERRPLDIINGPLMRGMDEVGRLFNENQLIVAEVLQSAEVMKAAVAHLEPFMEKADTATRGTVLLATVKGDVHDIGKNLVDIILSNNGYRVVNLGIKVAPETLIEAHARYSPDIIGLSGLLVKSAQQMVVTAQDLAVAGVATPILVGGAALSEKFTRSQIAPAYGAGLVAYAKDAMEGLRLANELVGAGEAGDRGPTAGSLRHEPEGEKQETDSGRAPRSRRSSRVRADNPVPPAPNYRLHVLDGDLDVLFEWINPQLLYGRDLGFRGNYARKLESGDPKALELARVVNDVRALATDRGWMRARAVYRFVPCASDRDVLYVFGDDLETVAETFRFPRQPGAGGLCLADYVRPIRDGVPDNICLFVTTAGEGVRERVEQLKAAGRYVLSHALGALAYEMAEAMAEWLHSRIRAMWGFADPTDMTIADRFRARYRGRRYSFGYPACPNLEDHQQLFRLLRPEDIGVRLTDIHMMDPEASVSALVFHHPDAEYFDVK